MTVLSSSLAASLPLPSASVWDLKRLLMVMDAQGCDYMEPKTCDLYIVPMGEDALKKAMGIASELREEGCFVEYDLIGKRT